MANGKRQIVLDEGSDAVVVRGGIKVEFNAGGINVYGNVPVTLHAPVNDVQLKPPAPEQTPKESGAATVTKQAYNIGDVLPDGWIVGPVGDMGIVMSIEPVSGALDGYKTWHQGEKHAAELRGQGNANARQPSANELNALYNNVVKAGHNGNAQFNTGSSHPYGLYWSSTPSPDYRDDARIQYLGVGNRYWHYKGNVSARVRCVRDEPGLTLA